MLRVDSTRRRRATEAAFSGRGAGYAEGAKAEREEKGNISETQWSFFMCFFSLRAQPARSLLNVPKHYRDTITCVRLSLSPPLSFRVMRASVLPLV